MKKSIITLFITVLGCWNLMAQQGIPFVDSKGHIHSNNVQIGSLTTSAGLDQSGKSVTRIDDKGNIVDSLGKSIGKAPKNGTFEFYMNDKVEQYNIGAPAHSGLCAVTNSRGKTVLLIHQNYKAQAACAIHCLYENHCMTMETGQ